MDEKRDADVRERVGAWVARYGDAVRSAIELYVNIMPVELLGLVGEYIVGCHRWREPTAASPLSVREFVPHNHGQMACSDLTTDEAGSDRFIVTFTGDALWSIGVLSCVPRVDELGAKTQDVVGWALHSAGAIYPIRKSGLGALCAGFGPTFTRPASVDVRIGVDFVEFAIPSHEPIRVKRADDLGLALRPWVVLGSHTSSIRQASIRTLDA